jgi:hypothetical protein
MSALHKYEFKVLSPNAGTEGGGDLLSWGNCLKPFSPFIITQLLKFRQRANESLMNMS